MEIIETDLILGAIEAPGEFLRKIFPRGDCIGTPWGVQSPGLIKSNQGERMTLLDFEEWLSAVGFPRAKEFGILDVMKIEAGNHRDPRTGTKFYITPPGCSLVVTYSRWLDGRTDYLSEIAAEYRPRVAGSFFARYIESNPVNDPREGFGVLLGESIKAIRFRWGGEDFDAFASIKFEGPELIPVVRFSYYRNSANPELTRKLSIRLTSGFGSHEHFDTQDAETVALFLGMIDGTGAPEGAFLDHMAELSPAVMKAILDLGELQAWKASRPVLKMPF